MTTSREQTLIEAADIFGATPIPEDVRLYFRERLRRRLHQLVLKEFARLRSEGFTRAQLARRIGKTPAQITRYLGGPGNWTIATVSDLLLGMGGEPGLEEVAHLADRLASTRAQDVTASQTVGVTVGSFEAAVPRADNVTGPRSLRIGVSTHPQKSPRTVTGAYPARVAA